MELEIDVGDAIDVQTADMANLPSNDIASIAPVQAEPAIISNDLQNAKDLLQAALHMYGAAQAAQDILWISHGCLPIHASSSPGEYP